MRSRRNKKAVSEFLVYLVLAVVGFVILAYILVDVFQDSGIIWVQRTVCSVAVRLRASSITFGLGSEAIDYKLGNRCKAINQKVTADTLYETLDNELESCWNRLGAGQGTLVSAYSAGLLRTEVACVPCAIITPKEGSLDFDTKTFEQYAVKHTTKKERGFLYAVIGTNNFIGIFDKTTYTYKDFEFDEKDPLKVTYILYKYTGGLIYPLKEKTYQGILISQNKEYVETCERLL